MNSFVVAVFGWMRTFADGASCAGTDIESHVTGGLSTRMPMPMLTSSWSGSARAGSPVRPGTGAGWRGGGVGAVAGRAPARCWRRAHIA
jgi:hypothetical protein